MIWGRRWQPTQAEAEYMSHALFFANMAAFNAGVEAATAIGDDPDRCGEFALQNAKSSGQLYSAILRELMNERPNTDGIEAVCYRVAAAFVADLEEGGQVSGGQPAPDEERR